MKEQQAKVRRANEGSKSKAKNVREATESIPGEKVPNSNAEKKNTRTYHYFGNYANV